jgi:hypothetical protein
MNSGAIVKKEVAVESIGNGLHFVIHYRGSIQGSRDLGVV